MTCKMERPTRVPLSLCDHTACLSVYGQIALCMDMAADHAAALGLGAEMLAAQQRFWLAVRTKISFTRRPALGEAVTLSTWPETAGRARCIRQYAIDASDGRIMCGKTEWAMMDLQSGRLCNLSEIYPKDTVYCTDTGNDRPFCHIAEEFSQEQCIGSYTVCSSDIDLGQHMNNAAYVRALFGMLSCREWDALNLCEAEFVYRVPCLEGETLQVYWRRLPEGAEAAFVKQDGKAAMLARLIQG